jgi:hypothetical protein
MLFRETYVFILRIIETHKYTPWGKFKAIVEVFEGLLLPPTPLNVT